MPQQKRIFCLGLIALVVWLIPVTSSAGAAPQQTAAGEKNQAAALPATREDLLMELPSTFDKAGEASWAFGNANHERYAYAAKRGKKWLMVADGKEGPEFVEVDSPRFSADGQHFAYRAVSQKAESAGGLFIRWKMVVDGAEGPQFEELSVPVFSPDSQHLAYRGKRTPATESREVLIFDGKEMKESEYASQVKLETMTREFDYDGQPVFSPDGRHWAYRARRKKNKEIMLVDGKESAEFEEITHPLFSPDSQHFAYRAKLKKNREVILLDGKETSEFDAVTNPIFSPNSRRLAYFAKREKKWHIILDEQEGPEIEKVGSYGPLFSPDSQHVVYLSFRLKPGFLGASWEVSEIRDSTVSGLHHFKNCRGQSPWFESPVFSPDGQRLAYVFWQNITLGYEEAVKLRMFESVVLVPYQEPNADRCVVVDGQESKIYDGTLGIDVKFSPDSQHFAYTVHRHKNSTVVVDGQEGKLYDDVIGGVLPEKREGDGSPPSAAFVYIAREGRKFYHVTQPLP